jgi:hypothetical protein
MSYAPYQRNTSGIVFFGEQGNQPTFYSDTNFLIQDGAAGYIRSPNLIIGDGGDIGSVSDPDSISIASNGNVTMSQSLSITGDLTVNGTTTTVNSTVVTIEDPIIILGQDSSATNPYGSDTDDNKDRGVAFAWNRNGAGPCLGFFGFDDSIQGFTFIPSGSVAGEVFSGPVGWARIDVSGTLAGNASTASAWETSRTITINDQMAGSTSIDGSANVTISVTANVDLITDQTVETSPDNNDEILIWDSTATALRRMTRGNFVSGLGAGSMDSFQVRGGVGSTHTINDADIFTLTGGSGIQTYGSGTDVIAINMKVDDSTLGFTTDVLEVKDAGITETQLNTSVAGNGLTGGGGSALAVGAGSLIDVTADAVDVDLTEAAAATIADGDYLIFLDGGTTGAESKGDTSDLATLLGGNGLTVTNSTLSVNAGNGLVLNGNAVDVDFSEFGATTLGSGDSFAVLDFDGTSEQRITISELGAYLASGAGSNLTVNGSGQLIAGGNFNSFDITGDTGTETVNDGETMTFVGAAGLDVAVTATNTVTYTIDISEYSTAAVANNDSFMMLDSDGTTEQRSTVNQLGTYMAGNNITNTNGVLSFADSVIDGIVFESANFVDSTTIDFTVTAGTSVTAIVKDTSITEAKRSRSVVTDSTTSTLASTDDVSLVNATGGAVTITLTGVATSGKRLTIKKTDSTANTVTIQRDGSSTIDGATTKILYSQYESITIISDGTNWHII